MEAITLNIPGLVLFKLDLYKDNRGSFIESFNKEQFRNAGLMDDFYQDNQSTSHKNVLRGLHLQNPPFDQGKLVRVARGSVTDVAVDVRKDSGFYGKHVTVELSEHNNFVLWIPPGFAHGFVSREDNTVFLYKCTKPYNKQSETGILWNDKDLNINWNVTDPIVSNKDQSLVMFENFISKF